MSTTRYRAALGVPGVRWLLATSAVARLPVAMTGLAIVLRVTREMGQSVWNIVSGPGADTHSEHLVDCYTAVLETDR